MKFFGAEKLYGSNLQDYYFRFSKFNIDRLKFGASAYFACKNSESFKFQWAH